MVTFIIPNYNKPEMTLRAVGSLYAHTKQFKCIVVDDGSPTQKELSAAIAKKFPDVQYISLPENRGFAVACNAGLRAKRAEPRAMALSGGLDALLNSFVPADSATQRKIAALLHRSPTYFSNARPDPIAGAWRTSVGKKLALAKALDAKRAEIEKVKAVK